MNNHRKARTWEEIQDQERRRLEQARLHQRNNRLKKKAQKVAQ